MNVVLMTSALEAENKAKTALLNLKKDIISSVKAASQKESESVQGMCGVIISLEQFRAVRSLHPEDYLAATQVKLVEARLDKCRDAHEVFKAVVEMARAGQVTAPDANEGSERFSPATVQVMRDYLSPAVQNKQADTAQYSTASI